ncbi:MAG TPA: DUF4468 domain-containing protein [Flavobacterium sp.]|nr:DUF4468 domain-containing protein [Flavobacterium sp.]
MKILIPFITLLSIHIGLAQTPNQNYNEQGVMEFSEVVETDGFSKEQLHNKATLWVVDAFNNSKVVTQHSDKENGQIVLKCLYRYSPEELMKRGATGVINFTFKILMKDGRYKYTISEFHHTAGEGFLADFGQFTANSCNYRGPKTTEKWINSNCEELKAFAISRTTDLIISLKSAMAADVNDGW